MRHWQEAFAKDDCDGEFGSYDEWARLGPQPLKVDAVLRSKILHGHETTRHSQ